MPVNQRERWISQPHKRPRLRALPSPKRLRAGRRNTALRCAGTRAYTTDIFQNAKLILFHKFGDVFIPTPTLALLLKGREITTFLAWFLPLPEAGLREGSL